MLRINRVLTCRFIKRMLNYMQVFYKKADELLLILLLMLFILHFGYDDKNVNPREEYSLSFQDDYYRRT